MYRTIEPIKVLKSGFSILQKDYQREHIDLVLMDLRMPIMSGYEAIDEIRRVSQDVPIIVLSAFAQSDDIEKIEQSGCTDYLSKPILQEDLVNKISEYLG